MDNLSIYEAVRKVPAEAKREIKGGRLNGKTDINPMWRIKKLTEQFGPCGIGWKYEITRQWLENGAKGEISAFCNILLYYKQDGEWSEGIPGTGGSAFVVNEKSGPYTSDECFKMALTDAISVAAKALGVAADVYWQADSTKYTPHSEPTVPRYIGEDKQGLILSELHRTGWNVKGMLAYLDTKFPNNPPKSLGTITEAQYAYIIKALGKRPTKDTENK